MQKVLKLGKYNVLVNYKVEVDDSDECSYDGMISHVVADHSYVVFDRDNERLSSTPKEDTVWIEESVEEFLETDAIDYFQHGAINEDF